MTEDVFLSRTESVCPECLATVPAERVLRGEDVFLRKTCRKHGSFETIVWRGAPSHAGWDRPKLPTYPKNPATRIDEGCPRDCGLCADHRQQTCCTLIEVTQRCNLCCPVCFAGAGEATSEDPDMGALRRTFQALLATGGPYNVQISGGEPTLREDLPEIVELVISLGFKYVQLNTNGLRLAEDPGYAKRLKEAGLACVFLQFDGVTDTVYRRLRGRSLFEQKKLAVDRCAEAKLGVILVPTVVPGVNVHEIGLTIDFALQRIPDVRGVHFQPISYFGRYPGRPTDGNRLTIPEIIRAIEAQTGGRMLAEHFKPAACENAYCSFHGNFVLMSDEKLLPWTRHDPGVCCSKPERIEDAVSKKRRFQERFWTAPATGASMDGNHPGFGGWDDFLSRVATHSFCVSGMAFQDAWNLDLDRLRECSLHVVHPDGRLVPFCAYNLTGCDGRSLYRV